MRVYDYIADDNGYRVTKDSAINLDDEDFDSGQIIIDDSLAMTFFEYSPAKIFFLVYIARMNADNRKRAFSREKWSFPLTFIFLADLLRICSTLLSKLRRKIRPKLLL